MKSTGSNTCDTQGCTAKKARSNDYCWKHLRENEHELRMSGKMQSNIQSVCCAAKCVLGEKHEMGNQYCKECKQACYWKIV